MAKKILIVDDDPGIVTMLKLTIEQENYHTVTARDGQEALDKIGQDTPDLMVLDINMPKIDGHALFKILRTDSKYRDIPIIMLTASKKFEDVKQCIGEGVEAYLKKPFKPEIFLGLIKGLLGE